MEACQGNELELVPHRTQVSPKTSDCRVVQFLLPIERRRAVVSQELSGILGMDAFRELPCFLKIGLRGLAPEEIRIRCIGEATCNSRFHTVTNPEKSFRCSLAGNNEFVV